MFHIFVHKSIRFKIESVDHMIENWRAFQISFGGLVKYLIKWVYHLNGSDIILMGFHHCSETQNFIQISMHTFKNIAIINLKDVSVA